VPISFSNIPSDIKIPLYYVEVDPSMAGLPVLGLPGLLVGTMLAAASSGSITTASWTASQATYTTAAPHGLAVGATVTISGLSPAGFNGTFTTVTGTTGSTIVVAMPSTPGAFVTGGSYTTLGSTGSVNVPTPIGSQAQADAAYGRGSELSRMFASFFANNFGNIVYGLGVAEPVGAVAATGTIVVTTAPTEAGTIDLYIGGQHVPVNVQAGDTVATVATEIATAINALDDLPVIASAATGTVTLTALWKGATANDITVLTNYYGGIGGEMTPPGLAMTLPTGGKLAGGVGVPVFTTAISNLGEQIFEYVALPYTDSNSLMAWETEYGFADTGRWGYRRQLYGHLFSAKRDTMPNLVLFGQSRNNAVTSVMAVELASPSPVYEWTAAYVGKAQRALLNDPARPLQTLSLNGIKLAPLQQRFNAVDLQTMASNGLATQKPGSDNQPMISRESTTYQLNLYGTPDTAYELVTTLATLARLIRTQKQAITSKFPRMKLANDGTRFGPGQAIVTPAIIKAELISEYMTDQFNGLVENTAAFVQNLLVERDDTDPNRVNVLYPPDLINQLRIFAVLAQFRLQYNAQIDAAGAGGGFGVTGIIPSGGVPI
jgi:phage tail sheath gpL-like